MDKIELAEKITMAILDREHTNVIADPMDDSEYIPTLRRIIDSVSQTLLKDGVAAEQMKQFSEKLHKHARQLYVDCWMKYAEEDEDRGDSKQEMKEARKIFDRHYFKNKAPIIEVEL